MSIYNIISVCFGSGVILSLAKYIIGRIKKTEEKSDAVKSAVQALLRDRLYQSYEKWTDRGYAPIYAKENFSNMYTQYHNLGENGVMDSHYKKFMKLPDKPSEEVA